MAHRRRSRVPVRRRWLRRRVRHAWLPMVRRRALFVLGGLAVGAVAVGMALLSDRAQDLFASARGASPWAPVALTPLGFGLAAWLTRRFVPAAAGSGIPQVIAAAHLASGHNASGHHASGHHASGHHASGHHASGHHASGHVADGQLDTARHGTANPPDPSAADTLVAPGTALAKVGLLLLGLACGASAGREGPTVQVGAATMALAGRFARHRQPGLLLAGSAAGVAAAFNAPLAGIIFGIEEMSRSFEVRTSGLILATVIAAGFTSLAVMGDYTYFGVTPAGLALGGAWLAVPVAGVVCGLAGGLFSRGLVAVSQGLPGRAGRWTGSHPVAFAVLCGLAVVGCGMAAQGSVYGTGYAQAQAILRGDTSLSPLFGPAKLLATALSSISGIPGGIFSPSLAVGAGLARDLAAVLPMLPLPVLAVLCMAAYLSGVVQAPLTAFAIVTEMTSDHALVVPIMLASLIASATSRLVCKEGLYHALAQRFAPRAAERVT